MKLFRHNPHQLLNNKENTDTYVSFIVFMTLRAQVKLMRAEGKLVREIMVDPGLSKASVFRALKR